ncbi:MAG: MMPL family transporter, partial [Chloroflexi bacterium]|nr:MMPL family transporter [Chloroflexota bacterium]
MSAPVTTPIATSRPPRSAPLTVRIAVWSSRHRWLVATLWLVLTIGVFIGSSGTGGIRTDDATGGDDTTAVTEASLGPERFAASGEEPPSEALYVVVTHPALTVTDPSYQTTVADIARRLQAPTVEIDGALQPAISSLLLPGPQLPGAALISQDRHSVYLVGRLDGDEDETLIRLGPLRAVLTEIPAAHPDFTIQSFNGTLINDDINRLITEDLDGSLKLTIPLTFLILLLAFGTVAAAVVPLVLAFTALLAAFGLLGIYSQVVAPVSSYATQLIVLIGLAVAVDYSLFMVSRFRTERRRGRETLAAIETASGTAGRAVFFSGLAVVVSLAGLLLMDEPLFRSMALGTIAVVVVSVVGSLTFLPAVLAILGRGV